MTTSTPAISQQPAALGPGSGSERVVPGLTGSVARVGARSRLNRELRFIASDLLGPYGSDELPAECSAWVRATIDSAVAGVSEAALTALVESLETELALAPADIAYRLREARVRHDAGFI